ncbi:hypothetical protein BDY19DRAFT_919873 [Irpex rosettiformis]|uniref:Uncharacterized protein n=1 Tax=Irpex rosettiformis TaxID=378272 RepID=A0ACB8UI41_9APHY|nr:hypothetical protein BDY19DRAFT_919873 [Irpex rosettiformis]
MSSNLICYGFISPPGVRHEYVTHNIFLAQDKSRISWALSSSQQPDTMQVTPSMSQPPPPTPPFTPPRRADLPKMLSPAEIRRKREEASRAQGRISYSDDVREEEERQEKLRREKEAAERQLRMEEERRQLLLEEDLRLAAMLRKQKEERERQEEEERHRKIEERRRIDRERRMRQAQKQQEWRLEQARLADETLRRKLELRTHVIEDRRSRSWIGDALDDELFQCWVNVQKSDNVAWRRRFCRIRRTKLALFKDKASTQPMELIDISSAKAVHEQMDGREELEGLKHAFALDLKDGSAYILYTDNEQEKETLASLIVQTARI